MNKKQIAFLTALSLSYAASASAQDKSELPPNAPVTPTPASNASSIQTLPSLPRSRAARSVGSTSTNPVSVSAPVAAPKASSRRSAAAAPGVSAVEAGAVVPSTGIGVAAAESDPWSEGVLEEDGNLNLDAAMNSYQAVIADFDQQRARVANAIFRVGEVYRKMGRLTEAKIQYARILREFTDQAQLARLSHEQLLADASQQTAASAGRSANSQFRNRLQQIVSRAPGAAPSSGLSTGMSPAWPALGGFSGLMAAGAPATSGTDATLQGADVARQKELIQAELKLVEQMQEITKKKAEAGLASPEDLFSIERDALELQREIAALERNVTRDKELLEAEAKLAEKQLEIIQRKAQDGRAAAEEVIKAERELLSMKRKLADADRSRMISTRASDSLLQAKGFASDRSQMASTQTSPYEESLRTGTVTKTDARTVESKSQDRYLPTSDPNASPLPVVSLTKWRNEAARKLADLTQELQKAEKEARDATDLLFAVKESKPEVLPASANADPRYQELKKAYQDALLGGPAESAKASLDRLKAWVEKIYLPELESQERSAHLKLERLNREAQIREQEERDYSDRVVKEQAQYRNILSNVFLISFAKDRWARGQKKQPGDPVTENDLSAYLKTGMPQAVAGETYQINPVGTPASAKLASPLGDLSAGAVIQAGAFVQPPSSSLRR